MAIGPFELLIILVLLGVFALWVWPHWVLCQRLGWSPSLSLLLLVPMAGLVFQIVLVWQVLPVAGHARAFVVLLLVPLVNLVMVFWLGFSEWPQREAPPRQAGSS